MHCDRIRQNRFDQKRAPNPSVSLRKHATREDLAKQLFLRKTMVGPAEKATRNHDFRREIQNELVRHRRARAIGCWTEIVVRTLVFE